MVKLSDEFHAHSIIRSHEKTAKGPAWRVKVLLEVLLPRHEVHDMARLFTNSHSMNHLWDVAPRIAHLLCEMVVLIWAV